MPLIKKYTFADTIVNGVSTNPIPAVIPNPAAIVFPDFTDGWIANDGAGDLLLTLANGNVLTLKSGDTQRWGYNGNVLNLGYTANGLGTTLRYAYQI
jgi:hypothetical protein